MNAAKVQKWGNSLALRIPVPILRGLGIGEGQAVELTVEHGALVVRPQRKRYVLSELLAQCDFDAPAGAEEKAWLEDVPVGLEEI
jgi:antitoxin ChpS